MQIYLFAFFFAPLSSFTQSAVFWVAS